MEATTCDSVKVSLSEQKEGRRGDTTHLLSLGGKDDESGEEESDEGEGSDGGQELGLEEVLSLEEDEETPSEECQCEWDACVIREESAIKDDGVGEVSSAPRKAATLLETVA